MTPILDRLFGWHIANVPPKVLYLVDVPYVAASRDEISFLIITDNNKIWSSNILANNPLLLPPEA
jgi:hypothetical protein